MTQPNIFKYFKTSSEIIRLAVMYYVRFPLSFRQVEDILRERGIDICHEAIRFWGGRFGATFASEIRKKKERGTIPTGNGIWMKFSSKLMVNDFTFGVLPITRAKC